MGDKPASSSGGGFGRRRLLLYGLAGTTAVAAGVAGTNEYLRREDREQTLTSGGRGFLAPSGAALTRRRRLGRTGLDVSVIGIGAGGLEGTGPIHRAVERGMNYIDTSACYGRGSSENLIGRAIKEAPALRDKLILATKWDAGAHMPRARMLESLDESLKRLSVDHVDIMQIHQLGDHGVGDDGFSRLDNPELYEAMEAARKAGKARFFGATGHTGNRSAILSRAIDKGAFDMILVKMNVLDHETADIPKLLAKAKAKDVGVVIMKSQPSGGAMPAGFAGKKWNVYQANLRWALAQEIACVVHSGVGTDEEVQDLAIGAAYDELGAIDRELLDRYAQAMSPEYCRGCDDVCARACPDGVAIPSVLRAVMYDRHYGSAAYAAYARDVYAELPKEARWSERCLACNACSSACPHGVDAAERVRSARATLA
jgi:predicted aldo/keto reductase-like oxidoreductase